MEQQLSHLDLSGIPPRDVRRVITFLNGAVEQYKQLELYGTATCLAKIGICLAEIEKQRQEGVAAEN